MTRLSRWLLPLLFGCGLLAAWYAVRALTGMSRFGLPLPHEVLEAALREGSSLLSSAWRTLLGAACGLGAATIIGVAMAMPMALHSRVRATLYPWVLVLQMTPLVVLIPLIVLWIDGTPAVILITFLISLFPIVANCVQGLLSVDPTAVEFFRLHHATRWQELRHLRLPASLPYVLTGAQISASLAIVGAVTGEIFAGSVTGGRGGLGYHVILLRAEGDTPAMLAAGLLACLLGFLFVGSVHLLRWRLLRRWHESFIDRTASTTTRAD